MNDTCCFLNMLTSTNVLFLYWIGPFVFLCFVAHLFYRLMFLMPKSLLTFFKNIFADINFYSSICLSRTLMNSLLPREEITIILRQYLLDV